MHRHEEEFITGAGMVARSFVAGMVKGRRVTIIGAARSGLAAAKLLRDNGAVVFVSDSGSEEKLASAMADLKELNVEFEIGEHSTRVFSCELIVVSPGVPSTAPVLRDAERRRIDIISELELASWFCPAPIAAITGTNGKTTTTTLTGRILHDARRHHVVAGNIGTSFSSVVDTLNESSVAVLEVSSFQLDGIKTFHPRVSVLLNITPDHLDRYGGSMDLYVTSKCRVFENQTKEDYLIYNYDDEVVRRCARERASTQTRIVPFGIHRDFQDGAYVRDDHLVTSLEGIDTTLIPTEEISIKGVHNLYNAMASALTAELLGVSIPSIRATLKNFKGVEHRLEFVRTLDGITYINDSKATNVDSVWYALQAYKNPLVLLVGGRDKGNDYGRLVPLVESHVRAIVAIGESADKVVSAFKDHARVQKASSMAEAVALARSLAVGGDIVMLSPACASFDWFENYEHRGRVFKQLVHELA